MPNVQFQVRLENIELSRAQINQIQKDINATVAKSLLRAGLGKDVWGSKLKLNPEWLGKWLRRFADLNALKNSATFKQERLG